MKNVISASRRTDLVAFFPEWLSSVLEEKSARIYGPSGFTHTVDLSPEQIHTIVLWSKNFSKLIHNAYKLRDLLQRYDQLYFHFTITGLGGSLIELMVPPPERALSQLEPLLNIAGAPERVTVRFDPVVYWEEKNKILTNLYFFEKIAPTLSRIGIKDIRFSFAQWYRKARRRAENRKFSYIDLSLYRWAVAPASSSPERACLASEGQEPAGSMPLHKIRGYRELHPILPPCLPLLLR